MELDSHPLPLDPGSPPAPTLRARRLRARSRSVLKPFASSPPPCSAAAPRSAVPRLSAPSTTPRRRPSSSRRRAGASTTVPAAAGTALSINEIYKRAGPGVVQITSTIGASTSRGRPVPAVRRRRSAPASCSTRKATSSRTTTSSTARPRSRCASRTTTR